MRTITHDEIVLDRMTMIASETDANGLIVYANADFCSICGYAKEEMIGRPHNMIRHPEMPKGAFADLWQTIQAVRELERSSGDAVKDIQALSTQFDTIEAGAKRTVELADDVRHALREQRDGIVQINEAVGILDGGMQEQAAAAEVLKEVSGEVSFVSHEMYEGIRTIRYA